MTDRSSEDTSSEMTSSTKQEKAATSGVSRRSLIASLTATAGVAGTGGAIAAGWASTSAEKGTSSATGRQVEPFRGPHQPGIATAPQQYALFAAFDLATVDMMKGEALPADRIAANFQQLMQNWTLAAERLMRGQPPGSNHPERPGLQTSSGAADGLNPARLTLTFGLGPDLFKVIGQAGKQPRRLRELPPFTTDKLEPAWSGGQLLVQICADDPQVVSHAFRTVRGRTPGLARLLWTQHGFLGLPDDGSTPRNLFGHKDGTANPRPGNETFDEVVWTRESDEPEWFAGGTYLVFRKIRMNLPKWDLTGTAEQDKIIGRRRDNGAPLSGGTEFTRPDLKAKGSDGKPAIASDAHVARVKDIKMLRRSYNYDYAFIANTEPITQPAPGENNGHDHGDGDDQGGDHGAGRGHGQGQGHDHGGGHGHSAGGHDLYDAGLLFCAYLRDPEDFIKAQTKLAESDRLNAFIEHTASAIFAVPPGLQPGQHLAAALFSTH